MVVPPSFAWKLVLAVALAGAILLSACASAPRRAAPPGDLRRLDAAFFTMNGVISVAFFAFVLADVL